MANGLVDVPEADNQPLHHLLSLPPELLLKIIDCLASIRVAFTLCEVSGFFRDLVKRSAWPSAEPIINWPAGARASDGILVVAPHHFHATASPGDKIQALIDRLPLGGSLLLKTGTYADQPIILEREAHIFGEPGVLLACSGSRVVVSMAHRATIDGVCLRRFQGEGSDDAVWVRRGRLRLQDVEICTDTMACVAASGALAHAILIGCHLHDSPVGLLFEQNSGGTIVATDIEGQLEAGIIAMSGADPFVDRSTIARSRTDAVIEGGDVRAGLGAGVLVASGGRGVYNRCEIRSNGGPGVVARSGSGPTFTGCSVHLNHGAGIEIDAGAIWARFGNDNDCFANALGNIIDHRIPEE